MFAVRVEYLTGRTVATEYNARDRAEWPPHPARLFSALVAAWANAERLDSEREALEWLERAGAPALVASEATARAVVMHYVPGNPDSVFSEKVRQAVRTAEGELDAARRDANGASGNKKAARRVTSAEARLQKAKKALEADQQIVSTPNGKDLERARAFVPATRSRHGRYFPSVTPLDPVVHFVWQVELSPEHREALTALAARVVRLGHSSSFVRCSIHDSAPEPNWFPDERNGDTVLRVVGPGQLASLETEFAGHGETEPRILPCRFQLYRHGRQAFEAAVKESVFGDDWIVFRRIAGPRLPATNAVGVASALRAALMKYCPEQPVPQMLSGHDERGAPAQEPHVAFVPLPFVGYEHADGAILGVALVFPREASRAERTAVLRAIAAWEAQYRSEDEEAPVIPLLLGPAGRIDLERVAWGLPPQATLRSGLWCRASRKWLSVTPVALDRNPGDLYSDQPDRASAAYAEAAETVAAACTHIGLPRPERVDILPSATLPGTYKAKRFPPYPTNPQKPRRVKVHACLHFEHPVRGPILLGAGRYFGLGLFRAVHEEVTRDNARS